MKKPNKDRLIELAWEECYTLREAYDLFEGSKVWYKDIKRIYDAMDAKYLS